MLSWPSWWRGGTTVDPPREKGHWNDCTRKISQHCLYQRNWQWTLARELRPYHGQRGKRCAKNSRTYWESAVSVISLHLRIFSCHSDDYLLSRLFFLLLGVILRFFLHYFYYSLPDIIFFLWKGLCMFIMPKNEENNADLHLSKLNLPLHGHFIREKGLMALLNSWARLGIGQ